MPKEATVFNSLFLDWIKKAMVKDEKLILEMDRLQKSIRRKHATFLDSLAENEERQEQIFKPITKPLNEIKESMKSAFATKAPLPEIKKEMSDDDEEEEGDEDEERTPMPSSEDELSGVGDELIPRRVRFYLDQVLDPRRIKEIDNVYGLRFFNNIWTMGDNNIPVSFINDRIHVDDRSYELTNGLLELLIFKNPSLKPSHESYQSDMKSYREILKLTGAHLTLAGRLKTNKSNKYIEYIKPLFKRKKTARPRYEEDPTFSFSTPHRRSSSPFAFSTPQPFRSQDPSTSFMSPLGKGLVRFNGKRKREYIHWDDPNELVERLRDLYDEYNAGNSTVYNEIISIVEELKEAGFIV